MFLLNLLLPALASAAPHHPRTDGVAKTPPMGWNSYNHYSCSPNETIIHSNAQALVDLGLADLGYRYVTTDCGWTVPNRLPNGSLTWNETLFPSGFPALGEFLHERGLLFGVYEDAGVQSCSTSEAGVQAGSLYHEPQDAATFMSWNIDALKYDNCYSSANLNYPNVDYTPTQSPRYRYANMTKALASQGRSILFQICDWGVDFPALWAPALGNTWRIGNDIIPAWRAIYRTLNQAVPNAAFAGPGAWPDLDMLEVGNGVFSSIEEETHFSLWGILKSPLVIGGRLKDALGSIGESSLTILRNEDVIAFNQDSLGVSAQLKRRWSEEGYEVWGGSLSGGRTVAAVINWGDEARVLGVDFADVGVQYVGSLKDVWGGKTVKGVKSRYEAVVQGHGVLLLELGETVEAGTYPASLFGTVKGAKTTFDSVYANTTSSQHGITITLKKASSKASTIQLSTSANTTAQNIQVPASSQTASATIALTAGSNNTITINSSEIESIKIHSPTGVYYTGKDSFTLSGGATLDHCTNGTVTGCAPVGYKIGYLSAANTATATIQATVASGTASKYIELDYINNDVAFSGTWEWATNSRNITISVNGATPVRLDVPLSGRHSELYSAGLGWWDTATLGLLLDGWKDGANEVVIGNAADENVYQTWGADFVGLRFYD